MPSEYLWFKGDAKFIDKHEWFAGSYDEPVAVALGYVTFIGGLSTKIENCSGVFTPISKAEEKISETEWVPFDRNNENHYSILLSDYERLVVYEWQERVEEHCPENYQLCVKIQKVTKNASDTVTTRYYQQGNKR